MCEYIFHNKFNWIELNSIQRQDEDDDRMLKIIWAF